MSSRQSTFKSGTPGPQPPAASFPDESPAAETPLVVSPLVVSPPVVSPPDRKLVTLRRIINTKSFNKGRYQSVKLTLDGGYEVVEQMSDNFSEGEVVLYFHDDAFIPDSDGNFWEEVAAEPTTFKGVKGYLVKTRMVLGEVSQGRALSLALYPAIMAILKQLTDEHGEQEGMRWAMDMSFEDELGVVKWEMERTTKLGPIYGPALPFIIKTGGQRVQELPGLFESHGDTVFQISEKLDGLPLSIYYLRKDSPLIKSLHEPGGYGPTALQGFTTTTTASTTKEDATTTTKGGKGGRRLLPGTGCVGVCTRGKHLIPSYESIAWQVVSRLGIPEILRREDKNLVVQGELCGSSITRNTLGYPEGQHEFFAFQVMDTDKGKYVEPRKAAEMLARWGIPQAPVLGYKTLREMAADAKELLLLADGESAVVKGQKREGLMLKNFKMVGPAVKVISKDWQLTWYPYVPTSR